MRHRPVSWPVVSAGIAAMGIGAVGLLFYFFVEDSLSRLLAGVCTAIGAAGAVAIVVGWLHDPSE